MRRNCVIAFSLLIVVLTSIGLAQEPTNTYLIEINGALPDDLDEMIAAAGGTLYRSHPELQVAVALSEDADFAEAMESYSKVGSCTRDWMVQWVPGPDDFELGADAAPGASGHVADPTTAVFYPCQWNMHQIETDGAWDAGEFGAGATVAVLDTGVTGSHIDLTGRVDALNSISLLSSPSLCDFFAPDMTSPDDFNFHGTFVAGIVAANGLGVAGVAPDATIVGVKVLNCLGLGTFSDLIAGILYAAQLPEVDVINMSLGAYLQNSMPGVAQLKAAVTKAVNFANSQGVLVVSAAGNEGADLDQDSNFFSLPAQAGTGVAAWSGDIDGNLASDSNHGHSGTWVGAGGGDVTPSSPLIPLPGCVLPPASQDGIISVCSPTSLFFPCGPADYLTDGVGTSFSSPMVAGVAALVEGKHGGSTNGGQLQTILKNTADDLGKNGSDDLYSHGRVNAKKAVQE